MDNYSASGVSAIWNESAALTDHGVEAVVNLDGPNMSAGVFARSDPMASSCYYFEVVSDPITSAVDEYGIYRRNDNLFTPLWTDNLQVIASGVPITPPSGTDIRVRLEVEDVDNGISISAWAGTTDDNFRRLVAITDTSPSGIYNKLYVGLMAAQPSGQLVSWDDFKFYVPFDYVYHDAKVGTSYGIGTETEPCSSLENLVQSIRTSRRHNGISTIRIRSDDDLNEIRIDHSRHKGISWTNPGLYITGYKDRPWLTAKQQKLLNITGNADYIWVKGLGIGTDKYGAPGKMFDYNNKHLRLTSIHALLGSPDEIQEYNDFTVGGALPSGVPSQVWCEYSFIDVREGSRSNGIFTTEANPSGLSVQWPPPASVKLDHVIVRGNADSVVYLHGSGTVDELDLDHLSLIDIGDSSININSAVLVASGINLGVDPTFKNSIVAAVNNTNSLDYGVNIQIDHKFITDRIMYWNVSTPEYNVSNSTNIISNEHPLFTNESAHYTWVESAVAEHSVSGIILPKDWRPTNNAARRSASDGTDLGALNTLLPPVVHKTLGTIIVEELLENLRPSYVTSVNYRYRYPMSSKTWTLTMSQIYKELVNLLGIDFVDQNFSVRGYIDSTARYIDESAERQFRYYEKDTTNRQTIVGSRTEIFSSGNYIDFFTDLEDTARLVETLYREWN